MDERTLRQIINHDMRTPVAVILGQCEMLDGELFGELTERQLKAIHTIARQAERLKRDLDLAAERVVELDEASKKS